MVLLPVATVATVALSLTAGLSGPGPATLALSAGPATGWRWPLAGVPVVARPFQPPSTRWGPGHRGVDLAAAPYAAVLAAGSGVVSFAGYIAGVGVVALTHPDGLRTTYEPVSPLVRAGQTLTVGQQLGSLLSGHGDCGPGRWCLHWGLLRGSTYLDPLTLVRRGPVRLLPLNAPPAAAVTAGAAAPAPSRPDAAADLAPSGGSAGSPGSPGHGASAWPERTAVASSGLLGLMGALHWWRRLRWNPPRRRSPAWTSPGRRWSSRRPRAATGAA